MEIQAQASNSSFDLGRSTFSLSAAILLMLLGEQLAFLVTLPHAWQFAHDPNALWLVFSTWPKIMSGPFLFVFVIVDGCVFDLLNDNRTVTAAIGRLRNTNRRTRITVFIFFMLLLACIYALPFIVIPVLTSILVAAIGSIIFIKATQAGFPYTPLWILGLIFLGLTNSLLFWQETTQTFACETGSVQLRSNETLPCSKLVRFSTKDIWVVEGPAGSRLVADNELARPARTQPVPIP